MKDNRKGSFYLDQINEIEKIQMDFENLGIDSTESDISLFYKSIPSVYLNDKVRFNTLLQSIFANLNNSIKRERVVLLLLERMKNKIVLFFENDGINLLKIIAPYVFIAEWLLENGLIKVKTIIRESKNNSELALYFLPEIIEKETDYYNTILKRKENLKKESYIHISKNKNNDDLNFSKEELDEIKERRRRQIQVYLSPNDDSVEFKSFDPNPLRCFLRNDDLSAFEKFITENDIPLDSICPPSVYEPTYFPSLDSQKSLIEIAALFGSSNILQYLLYKNVPLRSNVIFRQILLSQNIELFYLIEKHIMEKYQFTNLKRSKIKSSRDEKSNHFIDIFINNKHNDNDDNTNVIHDDDSNNNNNNEEVFTSESKLIREMLISCMQFAFQFGNDKICKYLFDKYDSFVDFKITANEINSRLVNFCLKDFRSKILPIIMLYPNDVDEYDNTYLMNVASFNYSILVELFLNIQKVDINHQSSINKATAISLASEQNAITTVEKILKSQDFTYIFDQNSGISPFCEATTYSYTNIMNFICQTKLENPDDSRYQNMLTHLEIVHAFQIAITKNQKKALIFIIKSFPSENFFTYNFPYYYNLAHFYDFDKSIQILMKFIQDKAKKGQYPIEALPNLES